ncbi:MAG: 16S rRNA methyltransferase, partial [Armatimonadetes bacterium]|nr:16S rRNA methyltransferase [Armatimonadota bacterium]
MRPTDDLDIIVASVKAGAGYRLLADDLVRSVAATEMTKRRSAKEAVKAARAKLHQLVGAYDDLPREAEAQLASADEHDLPEVARRLMAAHASTRERLPSYDQFWPAVLAGLDPPGSVLDLACGLNPLSVGLSGLPRDTLYQACDVHLGLLALCSAYLSRLGQPHDVFAHDLLSGPPQRSADLVLLLKTVPCLEQADKSAGRRLLAAIEAP